MSKNKHYTIVERKIFLEILQDFKHVIEVRKSDSSTLRDKEVAWVEICKQYNESIMIMQERTVQQLKKLWTNLKQTQRDVLTKEKQARLATGGGPPLPETNIDPDIALIAPHLMETAPVLFTSNMSEKEIDDTIIIEETNEKENEDINKVLPVKRKKALKEGACMQTKKIPKVEKNIENLLSNEDSLKIERIKRIIEDEKEITNIKKAHEERMVVMKENFYKELHTLEIRAATAKAELVELQLQKEKNK